ncbi:pyruvate dehydrogenase E2 component (dihydrolipoamide acetyltransferase) [Variovorax sp. HW608]|nr:pyruvate dehydrogenase E2 component (dihydrolipoamide acetyltransferase) [Variovorax sp. HW608]
MPALGADMEMGRLVQWRVPAGAHVKPGDTVAVVETQKGAIDVEIFLDGVLEDLVPIGTELPVGAVLAHVRGLGETPGAAAPAPAPRAARVRASPAARRRAQELGVDLAAMAASGPDGVIALADVERAAQALRAPVARPAPAGFNPVQMRAAIAAAMGRSKREIPHYYLTQAIDFGAAQQWLAAYNQQREPAERLLAAVLLLKATALALREVPQLNGFWRDGAAQLAQAVHPGWAISLRGGGLVAPALHDADRASLPALMAALRDLVQRARSGGLRSSELSDPTVTITNLGERGSDSVLGVIYPPQLALIGFGRIAPRPWVADGQLVVRPVVQASLAADHRASDGHLGARFLELLDAALQDPAALARSAP